MNLTKKVIDEIVRKQIEDIRIYHGRTWDKNNQEIVDSDLDSTLRNAILEYKSSKYNKNKKSKSYKP